MTPAPTLADALGLTVGPHVVRTAARPGEGEERARDFAAKLRRASCRAQVRVDGDKVYLWVATGRWTPNEVEYALGYSGFALARRTSGSFGGPGRPWHATWRVNP